MFWQRLKQWWADFAIAAGADLSPTEMLAADVADLRRRLALLEDQKRG